MKEKIAEVPNLPDPLQKNRGKKQFYPISECTSNGLFDPL